MSETPRGRVLIIAGSDSGGGAGIQADIKTVTALGGFAMTAVTAITVQNTLGVTNVHAIPPEIVREQIEAVMGDLGADTWKIGMMGSAAHVRAVMEAWYAVGGGAPVVLDPVMIAKGGASLLEDDAIAVIRDELVPVAAIVTPNAPEAEALTGVEVRDLEGQKRAADVLVNKLGAWSALVKGGHIEGDRQPSDASSTNRARAFASCIWRGVRQRARSSSGLATTTATQRARDVATFSRLRL